jgi:hypothetical protein
VRGSESERKCGTCDEGSEECGRDEERGEKCVWCGGEENDAERIRS